MQMRLVVNVGFITNSSSVIHWFPKEVLQDPDVQAFLNAYGMSSGTVGSDLWHRGACGSFLVTPDQYADAEGQLSGSEYCTAPSIGPNDGSAVAVIYGDEYQTVFSELSGVLSRAAEKMKLSGGGDCFN